MNPPKVTFHPNGHLASCVGTAAQIAELLAILRQHAHAEPNDRPESQDVPDVLKQPTTKQLGEHIRSYLTDKYDGWEIDNESMYELGEGVQVMLDTYGKSDPALRARIRELEDKLAALNARPQLDARALAEIYEKDTWDKKGDSARQVAYGRMRHALAQFQPPALTNAERAELEAYRKADNPLNGYKEVPVQNINRGDSVAKLVFGKATNFDYGDTTSPIQIDGVWGVSATQPKIYRKDNA